MPVVNNYTIRLAENKVTARSNFVILRLPAMNDTIVRYQYNPMLADTVGFFDYCVPLTNESVPPANDSLLKYYDFSIYNYITPIAQRQLHQTNSVFEPHNLRTKHSTPLAIERQSYDWITLIFLACLFVFAWLQTSYSKRMGQIFLAVAQPHYINQLEREGNLFKERITIGLGFIYYTISSIFVFLITKEYFGVPAGISNFSFTAIVLTGLFIYQSLKSAVVLASGIIFDTREAARQYQLNIMIFNYLIGVVLFPVVMITFYWNNTFLLISGIIIVLFLLLYRLFRGVLTGITNKSYNLFYLLLYLCTLEILPLIILYKAISKI